MNLIIIILAIALIASLLYIAKLTIRWKPKPQGLKFWKVVKGHRIYYIDDLDNLPMDRFLRLMVNWYEMGLGLKVSDLKGFVEMNRGYINDKNISAIGWMNETLSAKVDEFIDLRVSLALAGNIIFVDNEIELSEKHNTIKEMLLNDEEVKAFFLSKVLLLLTKLGELSNASEVLEYLKAANNQTAKAFLKSISKGQEVSILKGSLKQ